MNSKTPQTPSLQTLQALNELICNAERSISHAKKLMRQMVGAGSSDTTTDEVATGNLHAYKHGKNQIIEGVFNGRDMIGSDKKTYPVPANYASKSKIVEGSRLKVTIKPNGSLQYKIIEEIPFTATTGTVIKDKEQFFVISQEGMYQVIPAAITYLHAHVGDRVSIRIPRDTTAKYATIDAMIPADVGLVNM